MPGGSACQATTIIITIDYGLILVTDILASVLYLSKTGGEWGGSVGVRAVEADNDHDRHQQPLGGGGGEGGKSGQWVLAKQC